MRFPSFGSNSSKEDDENANNDNSSPPQEAASQSSVQDQQPVRADDKKGEKKGGLFSRKPKQSKSEEKKTEENKPAEQPKKSRFGLRKSKLPEEPLPTELVHVEGERVLVPSFDELDKYKSITYPVMEPYQFVNLKFEEGVLTYNLIEPVLTAREKAILQKVNEAFDMLVNVNTVLITTEDKLHFLEDTFKDILKIYSYKLDDITYQRLLYHIERDYVGYGRIDSLIRDRFIEDISCNGPGLNVFVYHRFFESIRTNVIFEELELNNFLLRLAQLSGRHISILQPIRDAALPDGSRVNMTLGKEVTKKGSTFTIRKFRSDPISPIEIMILHTADSRIFAYLWMLVEYGRSLLISGGTAAGKTTLLNSISMLVKPESKIVSVEDTPEINIAHPNWIQAVTRVGFGESGGAISGVSGISGVSTHGKGAGDISLYDLLISALRQRPDFIIVGEVRGEEAYTLFQAISVGHATMGTIHAASMSELLARTESQPMNVPRVLFANLDLVIFVAAVRKGEEKVRRVREIIEILGINPATKEVITNTVFRWDPVRDIFEYTGRSFQMEKISKSTGTSLSTLETEVANRAALFERMRREGITNYKLVTDVIRQYYLDKEVLLNSSQLTKLTVTNNTNHEEWGVLKQ